jgi:hypothetical protein
MTLPFALADTLRYLALALVWVLAGRALLVATGQRALGMTGWLLAPAVSQALVAVILGMSAVFRTPIKVVATPAWIAIATLAAAGLIVELRAAVRRPRPPVRITGGDVMVLGVAAIAPILLLLPCFVHGFAATQGTTHPDAWSYTIFGAYLWEYPRFTQGGLSPAFQWAANLSGTRFVAPGQLGWLAMATHEGDTAAAYGLLAALSTFIFGCASTAAGRIMGLSPRFLWLVALGAGAGNWIGNAVLVSNLDNLLALSYMPALAALGLADTPTGRPGRAVVCGLIAAATIYTYPEFAPVLLGCSALFLVQPFFTSPLLPALRAAVLGAAVAAVLVLPYAMDLWAFFSMQLASGVSTSERPGQGVFAGLLLPLVRPAGVWGLGPEDAGRPLSWPTTVAAFALFLLALTGLLRLLANRALAPLATLAILVAGFGVFEYGYEYSYGAYKFILLSWWLMLVAVAFGVRECARLHTGVAALAAACALATCAGSLERSVRASVTPPQPDMVAFRTLGEVEPIAAGAPVAVAVADNTAAHWAAYFLRGSKARLVSYSGYLGASPFRAQMEGAMPIPWNDLRLLLTDATDAGPVVEEQAWQAVWRNSRYTLWDTGNAGWAVVWKVENGYPYAAGGHLVWIGDKPVTIVATASGPGVATVHADLGLSQALPETAGPIRLRAEDGTGARCGWTMTQGGFALALGLHEGDNVVTLEKTSPTGIPVLPTADQRHPFMVGLVQPTLTFSRGVTDASQYCR